MPLTPRKRLSRQVAGLVVPEERGASREAAKPVRWDHLVENLADHFRGQSPSKQEIIDHATNEAGWSDGYAGLSTDTLLREIRKRLKVLKQRRTMNSSDVAGCGPTSSDVEGCSGKSASRKAGLGRDFVTFIHTVLKKPQGQMQNKVNRLRQRFGNDYDEIGKSILIEMGGELNVAAQRNNSTEAAINMVAKKYSMDNALVKNLFYAVGAPFQNSGAQFEMLKIKESKSAVLRKQLQELKSKDVEWEVAKGDLLHAAAGLKIRPEDKRTIQNAIQSANNYDKAESALVQMELKHQGMGAELAASRIPQLIVAYRIPWSRKEAIKKAQKAFRRSAGIRLATNEKGLLVVGDQDSLAATGMTVKADMKFVRFARSNGTVLSCQFHRHLSGKVTADVHMAVPANEAKRFAASLVREGGLIGAMVWDIAGTPHMITERRASNEEFSGAVQFAEKLLSETGHDGLEGPQDVITEEHEQALMAKYPGMSPEDAFAIFEEALENMGSNL